MARIILNPRKIILRMTWHLEKYLIAKEQGRKLKMAYHNIVTDLYLCILRLCVDPDGR